MLSTPDFSALDYFILVSSLLASLAIGVYMSIPKKYLLLLPWNRHKTVEAGAVEVELTDDYFLGDRKMSTFAVSMSLVASFISALTTLGYPPEVYLHGTSIFWYCVGVGTGIVLPGIFMVPVFFPLQYTSLYQYIGRRFDSKAVRIFTVIVFLIKTLILMGVALYGPAVALNLVTPLSITASVLLCGGICTVYTALGGIKGVIWTDVFQSCILYGAQIAVFILGVHMVGGLKEMWDLNVFYGRVTATPINPDPRIRHSVFPLLLSPIMTWLFTIGGSQTSTQRLMCLSSPRKAMLSLALTLPFVIFISSLSMACGFILTALFTECDPMKAGIINDQNQYLPYLVAKLFTSYPGMSGLFVAGIFSASLSSISSGINSMAAVLWEDIFLEFHFFKTMTNTNSNLFVKLMSLVLGAIPIILALLIQFVGGHIMSIGIKFDSLLAGAFCTVISAAYFVRFINLKGLVFGSILGTMFSGWLIIGSMIYSPPATDLLPTNYTQGCDPFNQSASALSRIHSNGSVSWRREMPITATIISTTTNSGCEEEDIDWNAFPYVMYRISYLWIGPLNFLFTFVITCLISIATGGLQLNPPEEYLFSWSKFRKCLRGDEVDPKTQDKNAGDKMNLIAITGSSVEIG